MWMSVSATSWANTRYKEGFLEVMAARVTRRRTEKIMGGKIGSGMRRKVVELIAFQKGGSNDSSPSSAVGGTPLFPTAESKLLGSSFHQ
jgi:hypothetical protein